MSFIKKHLFKFLIALSLCLSFVFIFAFTTNTYAQEQDNNGYEILPNGIQSKNLLDLSNKLYVNCFVGGQLNLVSNNDFDVYKITLPSGNYHFKPIVNIYGSVVRANSQLAPVQNLLSERSFTANTDYQFNLINTEEVLFSLQKSNRTFVMLNSGSIPLNYCPYGLFIGNNDFNWNEDLMQRNDELNQMNKDLILTSLQSGINTTLNNTNCFVYNGNNRDLSYMLSNSSIYDEKITFPQGMVNYNMQQSNLNIYNALINNNGEFDNNVSLSGNYATLLYKPNVPLLVDSLSFSRNGTEGTTYINLYFTDNSQTELILDEGSDNNRKDITWINNDNKYIEYISTTANKNFNVVYAIYVSNASELYSSGYDNGYTQGYYDRGSVYDTNISDLRNRVNQLETDNSNLKRLVEQYQENSGSGLGWRNLFFSMADIPLKTLSGFLGTDALADAFGINLFSGLIGIITVLAIVWLIKKLL